MTILLVLTGLGAIALPGLRPTALLRAHPRGFTRLAAALVGTGVACVLLGLLLSVAVGLLHLEFGHQSSGTDHLAPEGPVGSLVSASVVVVIAVRAGRVAVRSRGARRRAMPDGWLGKCEQSGGHQVRVLPTAEPISYSISGRRNTTVVISEGLRQHLDDDVLGLVIDHEVAHARAHDRRVLLLARCLDSLASVAPFAGRTSVALRLAVERAADEEATGADVAPRSRLAAHLTEHAATLASCMPSCGAFRAEQLLRPPRREPFTLAGAIIGLISVAVVASALVAHATIDLNPYLALLSG